MSPNKAVQSDNLRGVCLVVSLSFHFTTRQTPQKLRLTAALDLKRKKQSDIYGLTASLKSGRNNSTSGVGGFCSTLLKL